MTRSVSESAKGSGAISDNIHRMTSAALEASTNASDSRQAAVNLAEMAEQLRALVSQFKISAVIPRETRPPRPKPAGALVAV